MYNDAEFAAADGTILRGRFYPAQNGTGKAPVIVMASGFSGTMDLRLFPFAEGFARAGLAVLVYDHRNFGLSDGAVRQEVDPFQQLNDWRDAITYAQGLEGVDPESVGVWGSSFSGGHGLVLAATDARVKCVSVQVPYISGSQTQARQLRADLREHTKAAFAADRAQRMAGGAPMTIPVITEDPMQPAVLPTRDAYDFTMRHLPDAPSWKNEVTLRSLELAGAYEPGAYAALISPCPLLMLVGKRDLVNAPDLALDAYARALEPKRLVLFNGGHFDPYDVDLDLCMTEARDWFVQHLK